MRRNSHGWSLKPAIFRISDQVSSCFRVWDKCIQKTVRDKEGRERMRCVQIRARECERGCRKTHFDLYDVISETALAST